MKNIMNRIIVALVVALVLFFPEPLPVSALEPTMDVTYATSFNATNFNCRVNTAWTTGSGCAISDASTQVNGIKFSNTLTAGQIVEVNIHVKADTNTVVFAPSGPMAGTATLIKTSVLDQGFLPNQSAPSAPYDYVKYFQLTFSMNATGPFSYYTSDAGNFIFRADAAQAWYLVGATAYVYNVNSSANYSQVLNNIAQSGIDTQTAINNNGAQAHADSQAQTQAIKDQTSYIKDTTPPASPDTQQLTTAQSWLPAGPIDTLLNLPATFLSTVISSLGGQCSTVNTPLPFVSKNLDIPCFRQTLYSGPMAPIVNLVGVVPVAFILIAYFKHLFKRIERATSMQTSSDDVWGVL